jgi:hypothetical protein
MNPNTKPTENPTLRETLKKDILNNTLENYTEEEIATGLREKLAGYMLVHWAANSGYLDRLPKSVLTQELLTTPANTATTPNAIDLLAQNGYLDHLKNTQMADAIEEIPNVLAEKMIKKFSLDALDALETTKTEEKTIESQANIIKSITLARRFLNKYIPPECLSKEKEKDMLAELTEMATLNSPAEKTANTFKNGDCLPLETINTHTLIEISETITPILISGNLKNKTTKNTHEEALKAGGMLQDEIRSRANKSNQEIKTIKESLEKFSILAPYRTENQEILKELQTIQETLTSLQKTLKKNKESFGRTDSWDPKRAILNQPTWDLNNP